MKVQNETNRRLVNEVATVWVDGGGDAEGIEWLWQAIRDRVAEIEKERMEEK